MLEMRVDEIRCKTSKNERSTSKQFLLISLTQVPLRLLNNTKIEKKLNITKFSRHVHGLSFVTDPSRI